jgi:hypothetical protein
VKRTPLKRSGSLRTATIRKRDSDAAWEERAWRRAYLNAHPRCVIGPILQTAGRPEAANCRGWASELHERVKRSRGGSPLDPANLLPTCRPCHEVTEAEVKVSTELGLLAPRGPLAR